MKYSTKVIDQIAQRGVASNALYWVGTRYGRDIGPRLEAITRDILINQGLPLRDAAKAMADAFDITLGVARANQDMPQLSDRAQVPPGFRGSARDYFKGVASHVRSTSVSFGFTEFALENSVTWYVLSNPMDETTTELCAFLNGKVFSTYDAGRQRDAYLRAPDIQAAKAAMPFTNFNQVRMKVGFADAQDFDNAGMTGRDIAARGDIALPPFHFRCRTIAEPTGVTGQSSIPRPAPRPEPKPAPGAPPVPPEKKDAPVAVAPNQKLRKVPQMPVSSQNWSEDPGVTATTPRLMQPVPGWKPHKTIEAAARELKKFGFNEVKFEEGTKFWSDAQKLYAMNIVSYEAARFIKHGVTSQMRYLTFKSGAKGNWHGYFSEYPKAPGAGDIRRTHLAIDASKKTVAQYYLQPGSKEKEIAAVGNQTRWTTTTAGGIHACFRHEVAHAIKYMANQRNPKIGAAWSRVHSRLGSGVKKDISKYAAKDSDETFAEMFAAYTSPDYRPGNIDKLYGEGGVTMKFSDPQTGKVTERVISIEALIEETLQLAELYRKGL